MKSDKKKTKGKKIPKSKMNNKTKKKGGENQTTADYYRDSDLSDRVTDEYLVDDYVDAVKYAKKAKASENLI